MKCTLIAHCIIILTNRLEKIESTEENINNFP